MIQNPIPTSTRAKNNGGYDADSGLDILVPTGTPCLAVADGRIIYSERGHTPWVNPPDTPHSVLLQLDEPFEYRGHKVNFAWYTHLSRLAYSVPDGTEPLVVKAGQVLGWSGVGNKVPHLHLGLISNRAQEEGQTMPFPLVAELIWDMERNSEAPPAKSPSKPAEPEGRPVELLSAEFVVKDEAGNLHKLFWHGGKGRLVP